MRTIAAISATFLFASVAAASNDESPIRYRTHTMKVIMHSSTKPINIQVGDNPLGQPRSFICKSAAGCVVIMAASLYTGPDALTASEHTCSFIDGVPGAPDCPDEADGNYHVVIRDMATVGPGEHTVETKMNATTQRGEILGWETDYTIYERPAKAAN